MIVAYSNNMPINRILDLSGTADRRWGEQHNISRKEAYAKGINHISDALKWCKEEDVRMLSMWGFSTDNFNRDRNEIDGLFELFKTNLRKVIEDANREKNEHKDEVRVRFIGRTSLFPKEFQELIRIAEEQTKGGTKYQLNLLLAYGGHEEIIDAVNSLLKEAANGGKKEITSEDFANHLYTKGVPNPDLVIRTSGEQRTSGLLPWQSAY
ncbi:MAG: polyprenyl diphosphate synthase, partial [Candidatus Micrarchaeia archaeon]